MFKIYKRYKVTGLGVALFDILGLTDSWNKSDSKVCYGGKDIILGPNDLALMRTYCKNEKNLHIVLKKIHVYAHILAPLDWCKEFSNLCGDCIMINNVIAYSTDWYIMVDYDTLMSIYHSKKDSKLDEWKEFCAWIEQLPYSSLITHKD